MGELKQKLEEEDEDENRLEKSKAVATFLALFLGFLGIHELYLTRRNRFILYFIFAWTGIPLVASILQGIKYYSESDEQFDRKLEKIKENKGRGIKIENND